MVVTTIHFLISRPYIPLSSIRI